MKKIAVFALGFLVTVAAHAQVFTTPFFNTPPIFREGFDTTIPNNYNAFPVFGSPAFIQKIGPGSLTVTPYPGVNTFPNLLFGNNANVRIVSAIPMRRFGGYFNSGYIGAFASMAKFVFYDAANNVIGSQTVTLTTTLQWVGFLTIPKWRKVEIYGNVAALPGLVGMDSLRIRPW